MRGHARGEPAIVCESCRSRARGGESAGLVYRTERSRIALNPASHQRSVVVDITIWTPRYAFPLPHRVEEKTEPATLISGRIQHVQSSQHAMALLSTARSDRSA